MGVQGLRFLEFRGLVFLGRSVVSFLVSQTSAEASRQLSSSTKRNRVAFFWW